jgi:hypothetical protein
MTNEFDGVTQIVFDPKGGDGKRAYITGDTWLVNWGIDPIAHPNLLVIGMGFLAGYAALFLVTAYLLLAVHQRYVK